MSESEGSKIHFRTKDRFTLEKEIIFQEYCGPLSLKYVCDYFGIPATQTEMARKTLYVPGEGTDTPEVWLLYIILIGRKVFQVAQIPNITMTRTEAIMPFIWAAQLLRKTLHREP
ncbi:MAG: hypothetical protein UX87_C0019G0061 [Candidatus Amesbacteria bacterium GW2011_GWA1_47_16]|uniref:Uncharacterized protein n=1 Tax=Candidatus Amesbacteria bacterium GW2011_GWA1_47_16 TaxID=1618353 RepID=A0A0G1S2J3_9BACT|nr:MAG: hypothetical protein UX87_C0019G0061 [Candidatus Amesbacteria bacterium GW2011_GWA1_47_16]